MNPKFGKSFLLICRGCRVKSVDIIANALHFHQYSRSLNIFSFLAHNLLTKFEV